jgi:flagellar biogenesis protein FliO
MVTEMRQQSAARQVFRYFGTIAMILIVVAALCWGFAHI